MPPHELCAIVGDLVRKFQATPDMVHFNGQLLSSNFDNNVVMSDKIRVLFDTGALCANYISKRIFTKIKLMNISGINFSATFKAKINIS